MVETPHSLLERLNRRADAADWDRLVQLYSPLLQSWLRRRLLQDADVNDLVQDVLLVVVREAPAFQHNGRPGAFRAWLRQVLANRVKEFHRKNQAAPAPLGAPLSDLLNQLEDPSSQLSALWDEEHDRSIVRRALELIAGEFESATWRAFTRVALDGLKAGEAAAELGLTPNAVYIAKSRVMARLTTELAGLVETVPQAEPP